MLWTSTPLEAIEIEHVRNGSRFDVGTKLGVAFQDQVVVTDRVVLNVAVSVWRQWRAVWILGLGIENPLAVFLGAA